MAFKPKTLAGEQDPDTRCLLEETLAEAGADWACLDSSAEAARRIEREKCDGFFLSLTLSSPASCELVEKIRWSKSNSRCPIVVITDNPEPAALKSCFRTGVNFFLQKPVNKQHLETLLNATRGIMAQERRRYQRAPIKFPVRCKWEIQSLPQAVSGESINLSASGIQPNLELTPPPGGVVEIRFTLPGDRQPLELTTRIARLGPGQHIGLTFVGLSEEQRQRLMKFTDKLLARPSETPLPSTAT
jgi:CheY-like chemotaxis protein